MSGTSITSEIALPDISRACLISNADSGANLKYGLDRVEREAAAAGLRHRRVNSIDMLSEVLKDCAHRGDRLIVVNAGDGTVCRLLEHIRNDRLFPEEPMLALLRGGTTNMIHNDVGIPGRPEAALRRLSAWIARGGVACRERRVMRITSTIRPQPRYGFFLGTNAAVRAILLTRARLHQRVSTGRLSESLSIGAMIWRLLRRRIDQDPVLSPVPLELCRDGDSWRQSDHILLIAMSVHTAILGIRPLKHGQDAAVAVLDWPDYRLFPWLRRFLTGRLEAFQTLSLRGQFSWVLDGEIHEHDIADGVLTIEATHPVRFLVRGPGR